MDSSERFFTCQNSPLANVIIFFASMIKRSTSRIPCFTNVIAKSSSQVNKKKAPAGFLSMKVLGHEMRVFSYDDIQWAADEIDNMNVIELLLKVAKGGRKTFTKSMMFLEMTHSVPTAVGLPLKLKLTGSAVGSLELNGKFDVRNMFWGPMALEVKGSVKPRYETQLSKQTLTPNNSVPVPFLIRCKFVTL